MSDKSWRAMYPTVADVKKASLSTLDAWDENLPPPQNDVERTVLRRIKQTLAERCDAELKEKAPGIHKKMMELNALFEKTTGIDPVSL